MNERRQRRATSVLELVIGLTLTGVILLAGLVFVSTLMQSSAPAIDGRAAARDAAQLDALLSADLGAARPCEPSGAGWAFTTISSDRLVFFADVVTASGAAGPDGFADRVEWVAADGAVTRTVLPSRGAGCEQFADPVDVVVSEAFAGGAPFTAFDPTGENVVDADCAGWNAYCDVASVRFTGELERPGTNGAPVAVDVFAEVARTGRWSCSTAHGTCGVAVNTPRVPGPIEVTGVDVAAGSATVSFTEPAEGAAPVEAFEYSMDGGVWLPASSSGNTVRFTGLVDGVEHRVRLRARNSFGVGPRSEEVRIMSTSVPGAPAIMAVRPSTTSLSVTVAAGADGGAPLSGFEYRLAGTDSWVPAQRTGAALSLPLPELGETVEVEVRARNRNGVSAPSEAVEFTMVPPPPSSVVAVAPDGTSDRLEVFFAPHRSATGYDVSFDGGASWEPAPAGASAGVFTLDGLDTATRYTVVLRGRNAAGAGPMSSAGTTRDTVSLVLVDGAREWSDGERATSCSAYKNPEPGRSYTGATGSGLYRVVVTGVERVVWCDMEFDENGWTLVARFVDGLVPGTQPFGQLSGPGQLTSAKLSDYEIDALRGPGEALYQGVVRVDGGDQLSFLSGPTPWSDRALSELPGYVSFEAARAGVDRSPDVVDVTSGEPLTVWVSSPLTATASTNPAAPRVESVSMSSTSVEVSFDDVPGLLAWEFAVDGGMWTAVSPTVDGRLVVDVVVGDVERFEVVARTLSGRTAPTEVDMPVS